MAANPTTYPTYNSPVLPNKCSASFIYDPNYIDAMGNSGAYRPYSTSDVVSITGVTLNVGLDSSNDSVSTVPSGATSVTAPTGNTTAPTAVTSGLLFAANPSRLSFTVQNSSTTLPLYLLYGTGTAVNSGSYHVSLNPASTAGYAGGVLTENSWKGAVSFYASGAFSAFQLS